MAVEGGRGRSSSAPPLGPEIAKQAGNAAMAGARPLAKNGYKVRLFEGLIETEILKAFAAGAGMGEAGRRR